MPSLNLNQTVMQKIEAEAPFRTYMCVVCGLIYDEAAGWPADGIRPGTRWDDVPDSWVCPDCGVGKADFEMIAIS
jgi:rubredoxin